MGAIRLGFRAAWICGLLLLCLPLHYAWKLAGVPSPWPRRFLRGVGRAAGMRVRVSGQPLAGQALFVANHSSWLDIMILAGASGAAFVSREDVGRWPVIGWLARLNNTLFVERTARSAVRSQADALRAALARGQPVALFPEGTTDGGAEVLPFRASLLASLYPPIPGVAVQPVAIDYGAAEDDIAWVGEEGAAANAKRVLSRRGTAVVALAFLDPLDPAAVDDRKRLAELARGQIVAYLDRSPRRRRGSGRAFTAPVAPPGESGGRRTKSGDSPASLDPSGSAPDRL